ncbi:MAG: OB-fold nucleic acid binding domain-containing protein [Candidatus Woesearchaeota archaeon]
MLKIPMEEVIARIKEKSGLSEDEILKRMDEKIKLLSGMISREGAAYILAHELNIKLFDSVAGRVQIKNILSGMRDVETVGRVEKVFPPTEFSTQNSSGKVSSFVLSDETGSIRVVLWNEQAELAANLKENDIVKIKSGYVRERNGQLELHLNSRSKLILNPPEERVPELVKKPTNIPTTPRRQISDLKEGDYVQILGTITQVFDLHFYETCPECRRRLKQGSEGFICEVHGPTSTPSYSFVLNFFVDDGTGTVRVVCFKEQVLQLLKLGENEVLSIKSNDGQLSALKNSLLGMQVLLEGRVSKNPGFDRIEFRALNVNPDPDPKLEIQRLKSVQQG